MRKIKILVIDVDGTLTDGKIYMTSQGEMFKAFNTKDGYGICNLLPNVGILPVIITGRESNIVVKRCKEIGVNYIFQGCQDKLEKLKELAHMFGLSKDENGCFQEVAYIGDDCNDLPSMQVCGLVGCPSDAVNDVKKMALFISSKNGGDGAVREFIDYIIRSVHKQ